MRSDQNRLQPAAQLVCSLTESKQRIGLGTFLGLCSAVGYTLTNICLRAVTESDPYWVSCVKAAPTVAMVLPWVGWQFARRRTIFESKSQLVAVFLASVLAQVGGNVAFQWSLGVIGLALAVPFTLGTILIGSTALGHWWLREIITKRTIVALAIVTAAVCILCLGANEASASIVDIRRVDDSRVPLAILVVCGAGFAYSVLGGVIRWSRSRGTPMPGILFVSGMVGVVLLGTICLVRPGWESIVLETTRSDLTYMLLAGVFNALAFAALVSAMHLSGLVYINALNASQTAMASLAGVMFFSEALTWPLVLGVALTGLGLVLVRNTSGNQESEAPAAENVDRIPPDPP